MQSMCRLCLQSFGMLDKQKEPPQTPHPKKKPVLTEFERNKTRKKKIESLLKTKVEQKK